LRAGLLKCESVKIAAISRNNIVSFDAHGSSVRPLAGAFFFGERVSWLPRQARGLSVSNGFQKLLLSRETGAIRRDPLTKSPCDLLSNSEN